MGASERTPLLRGRVDPALSARVVRRRPLFYDAGADPAEDRPAHVRAGSGLAWLGDRLAVLQDDASFLALVEPASGSVEALALPRGPDGRRLFDDERGNKDDKLDLEACVGATEDGAALLLAFGSGSTRARETVAEVALGPGPSPRVRLHPAPAFYEALRSEPDFAGSELNLEGAALLGEGRLRLFQRGNGAPRGALQPVDATCEVGWQELLAHLRTGGPPPRIQDVVRYELGELEGVRLTFTDATPMGDGRVLFLATAEDSPDAVRDGEVFGTALGVLGAPPRWTPLRGPAGEPLRIKAEGIAIDRSDPSRAHVVLDSDGSMAAAELLEVALEGPWHG